MESTDDLHPNWRALATIHLPLKRFVREGAKTSDISSNNKHQRNIPKLDGVEIKQFYERLTANTDNIEDTESGTEEETNVQSGDVKELQPFDQNKFFRYAMSGDDAHLLQEFDYKADEINSRDEFGWTALMMAACAGATEAVAVLLQLGACRTVRDKRGRTAAQLAEITSHSEIAQMLNNNNYNDESDSDLEISDEKIMSAYFCKICNRTFKTTSHQEHLTSLVHQFNEHKAINKMQNFNISDRNRGLQLMLKQGWDRHSGLGPSKSGRLYPVKTVIRKQRTGLGIKQKPARVTHFNASDTRATKSSLSDYSKKKTRNRNDIRREKQRDMKIERRLRRELS